MTLQITLSIAFGLCLPACSTRDVRIDYSKCEEAILIPKLMYPSPTTLKNISGKTEDYDSNLMNNGCKTYS